MSAMPQLRPAPPTPPPTGGRTDGAFVCQNVVSPLSSVLAHRDVECIRRLFAAGFPVYLAIHEVRDAAPRQRDYTEPHAHEEAEINIIIPGPEGLVYEIQIGEDVFHVSESASIYVPPNVRHSANVIRGSGHFIAMRLNRGWVP